MTVCVYVHVDMHVYQSVHGLYNFHYASGYSIDQRSNARIDNNHIDERSNARIDIKTAHAAVLNASLLHDYHSFDLSIHASRLPCNRRRRRLR